MSQEQLNVIIKIIQNGAPALAEEMISAIAKLIAENNDLHNEVEILNKKVASYECSTKEE